MEELQFDRLMAEVAASRRHTDEIAERLVRHTDDTAELLRGEIRATAQETRRHFDVVAEDLRGTDRLLAEGIATVDAKIDRFGLELRSESAETRAMIKISYSQLDRRLAVLEKRE